MLAQDRNQSGRKSAPRDDGARSRSPAFHIGENELKRPREGENVGMHTDSHADSSAANGGVLAASPAAQFLAPLVVGSPTPGVPLPQRG